jgi:hypothetical protein
MHSCAAALACLEAMLPFLYCLLSKLPDTLVIGRRGEASNNIFLTLVTAFPVSDCSTSLHPPPLEPCDRLHVII